MSNVNHSRELFLVLYSILYGVMLQSLNTLRPFPWGKIRKGHLKRNKKPNIDYKECEKIIQKSGKKPEKWLKSMWIKRLFISIIILNILPILHLWLIYNLLNREIFKELNITQFFYIFGFALGVFGFYRIYHAIAAKSPESLFCDVKCELEKRGFSYDTLAHSFSAICYFSPLIIFLLNEICTIINIPFLVISIFLSLSGYLLTKDL